MLNETSPDTGEDFRDKWKVMAAVAMGIFLATLDGSIVNIAIPVIQEALKTDFATIQWVILVYLLVLTTLMLGMGRLGDMIGKKPVYLSGIIIFTTSSVLCGTAPSVPYLILFRALQGVGASMVMALGAAIVTEAFPPYERGKALGVIGTLVSIGIMTGPVLGGVLLAHFSWHWIFFVNLPVGIVGTLLTVKFISSPKPPGGQRFDYPGALSLFTALIALLLGLTLGQRLGFSSPTVGGLGLTALLFIVLFIAIELNTEQPMLDLSIFRTGHIKINVITGFATFVAMGGLFILIPYYLEKVLHYEVRKAGLLLSVVPISIGVMAPLAGRFSDRWGTRPLTLAGLAILAFGFLSVSGISLNTTPVDFVLRFLPVGIGMGIFQSPNNSAILGSVQRNRLGVASGLLSITRTLGQTVGVSLLSTIWATSVYLHGGQGPHETPTSFPLSLQVEGLQITFLAVSAFITLSFLIGLGGTRRDKNRNTNEHS